MHYVYLTNASDTDKRSIEFVRTKLRSFAEHATSGSFLTSSSSTATSTTSAATVVRKKKMIILDEADALTKEAMDSLRRIIENTNESTVFCFICNNINHLLPAIRSRCSGLQLHFVHLTDEEMIRLVTTKFGVYVYDEDHAALVMNDDESSTATTTTTKNSPKLVFASEAVAMKFVAQCRGDVRVCMNALEMFEYIIPCLHSRSHHHYQDHDSTMVMDVDEEISSETKEEKQHSKQQQQEYSFTIIEEEDLNLCFGVCSFLCLFYKILKVFLSYYVYTSQFDKNVFLILFVCVCAQSTACTDRHCVSIGVSEMH